MFKKAFGVLQKIGKALMLPVALLPAAGLLLGIGNAMQQETMLQYLPFLMQLGFNLLPALWRMPVGSFLVTYL